LQSTEEHQLLSAWPVESPGQLSHLFVVHSEQETEGSDEAKDGSLAPDDDSGCGLAENEGLRPRESRLSRPE
jgi:hypothetical protein